MPDKRPNASVVVVADDLTGANATGARFARRGLRTLTVRGTENLAAHAATADVLVVDTGSRHVPAEEAARLVTAALTATDAARLVVKRTDTTLRGNVGAETEAALTWLRERHEHVRGIMVPAFPDAGRATVGGLQLVDGVPLSQTDVARDPRGPVTESRVTNLVRSQADLSVREVTLDTVIAGREALRDALDSDADVTVVDAVSRTDLRMIALAAAELADRTHWLSIDPGPFGPELASALGLSQSAAGGAPLLVAAGSATSVTRAQLGAVERMLGGRFVTLDVADLSVGRATSAALDLLEEVAADGIVGLRTLDGDQEPQSLSPEQAQAIPTAIGEIVAAVLEHATAIGGLYVTGGDVTLGVLDALGCHGMAVDEEVLPLAVAGRLAGGVHDGLPVVTKGGLIGDETAAVACLDDLRVRVTQHQKSVG